MIVRKIVYFIGVGNMFFIGVGKECLFYRSRKKCSFYSLIGNVTIGNMVIGNKVIGNKSRHQTEDVPMLFAVFFPFKSFFLFSSP